MSGETLPAATGQGSGKIHFNDEAPRNVLLLLYTEGFVTRPGIWKDHSGIIGWGYMPEVDKQEREECLRNPHSGFRKPFNPNPGV